MTAFSIVLLAMIAAFLGMRLYSVLGKRTGHEQEPVLPRRDDRPERQHLYFGFALNLQEVLNRGLFNRPRAQDNRAQEAARGFFADWAAEHIQVPYTAVPLIQLERTNHED